MVPPVEQGVLERPYIVTRAGRAQLKRIRVTDLVALSDAWIVLALIWGSRFFTGAIRLTEVVFAVIAFGLLSTPKARAERLTPSALDDASTIFTRVWIAYAATCAASVAFGLGAEMDLLALTIPMAPAAIAGRAGAYALHRRITAVAGAKRALVVGTGDVAERVMKTLAAHDEYGLQLIGAATDDDAPGSSSLRTRRLGRIAAVASLVQEFDIDVVIVAFEKQESSDMTRVLRDALNTGAHVWIVPRFFELGCAGSGDHLWGLPVVRIQPPAQTRPGWLLKRAMDIVVSTVALVLLAPVMLAVALAIHLESGGPVLLRQRRVGLDGAPFDMLKFRTMRPSDDAIEATEWSADEDRITKVGRRLRDTSIDELPQFINVLKGEMSLVGPRPERPHFVDMFSERYPNYAERHRLPAGVTGWSQIHGLRGDTSIEERAAFDNYYVDNWSLSQDVKIVLRTLTAFRQDAGGQQ